MPLIRLHQYLTSPVACLARNDHHLTRICTEDDPVKEVCEEVEHPQQPLRLRRGDESIVGIKIFLQVLYQQAKLLPALLGCLHHIHPVADEDVYDLIEERGGKWVSLCHSPVPFEW